PEPIERHLGSVVVQCCHVARPATELLNRLRYGDSGVCRSVSNQSEGAVEHADTEQLVRSHGSSESGGVASPLSSRITSSMSSTLTSQSTGASASSSSNINSCRSASFKTVDMTR